MALVVLIAALAQPQVRPAPADPVKTVQQARAASEAPILSARLKALGRGFDGEVGIAVRDIDDGWTASFGGDQPFPQQSVSKLWVALAILDQVDQRKMALSDTLVVRKSDLSVFNQPLRKFVGEGGYATSIEKLLVGAIGQSDNAANDLLMRHAGGPQAVQALIAARGLGAIRAGPGEKVMQTKVAGLSWRPEYSFDRTFWQDRDALSAETRAVNLDEYLRDPVDAATPEAIVAALTRLQKGELLSPASTALLIRMMAESETGQSRLRAGLAPGWTLAHKTGTGQVMGVVATGFNDVGILTAPDGHAYAVAVMISQTRRPVPERQVLMAEVTRAVIAQHDASAAQRISP